jgi:hypothetical protein
MSLQTAPDIPLIITVPGHSTNAPPLLLAERRISPSWSIGQLKAKLEPVTGIPPSVQRLRTRGFDGNWVAMEGEEKLVGDREWSAGVRRGGEIEVSLLHLYFVVLLMYLPHLIVSLVNIREASNLYHPGEAPESFPRKIAWIPHHICNFSMYHLSKMIAISSSRHPISVCHTCSSWQQMRLLCSGLLYNPSISFLVHSICLGVPEK